MGQRIGTADLTDSVRLTRGLVGRLSGEGPICATLLLTTQPVILIAESVQGTSVEDAVYRWALALIERGRLGYYVYL